MTRHRILVTAGGTRRGSFDTLLAHAVADELARRDRDHLLVSLGDHDMPIYHGDHEDEHGVPTTAHELAALLRDSGGLLIASPEYNGSFEPAAEELDRLGHPDRHAACCATR